MPIDYDNYEEYGDAPERRGGGGKHPHKGPTKSDEAASVEEKARLVRERQEYAEKQIKAYIDETWRSYSEEEREEYIPKYVKFMEKAARQKNIVLEPEEIKKKVKRSSGAGGQNVQKNATAVDLTHKPTQLKASSQDERSQEQNTNKAMVELKLRVENHVRLWKATSPEFRKSLLKSPEVYNPKENSFSPLPEGVSIGELRDQVPPSEELIVKFGWENDTDGKPKIAQVGEAKYPIYPNVQYRININPDSYGEIYMNPVDTRTGAPEESNIPRNLDKYLASENGRKASGMTISVRNSDIIADAVKRVTDINKISVAYEKLRTFSTEFAQSDLDSTIRMVEELLDLDKLDKGSRAYQVIYREAWLIMESKYIGDDDRENIDLKTLAEDSILKYMQGIKQIVDTRPQELKNLALSADGMAIRIDSIPIDESDPDHGLIVLTTYIPARGWTVMVPVGDCPNLAANMLEKFGQGRLSEQENQIFYKSVTDAIDDGTLRFSNDGRTIIFNKVSSLDLSMAVFHGGNNTLKEAMETLKAAGDPVTGERVFHFIIYKDDSEIVYEEMPPIDLTDLKHGS